MKQCFIFIVVIIVTMTLSGKKLATLPGLSNPFYMAVDDRQFYVTDGPTISIFSLKDFTLKKKFGKAGEGPQEFNVPPTGMSGLMVHPQDDSLVINSPGKVVFFNKDGEYIKEIKSSLGMMGNMFQPLGNRFAGMGFSMGENQTMTLTINIFDGKLTKIKEIYSQPFFKGGNMEFPMVTPVFYALDNKIITPAGQKEFAVDVLDAYGNKLASIRREYKLLKVTDDYKKGVHETFKLIMKEGYAAFKNRMTFSDEFPPIQVFYVDNQKIYIQTYSKKDDRYEFFIYDFKGKFLKQLYLPVTNRNAFMSYPTAIKNNMLYQVIENEDEEEWELHATKIE